MPLDPVREPTTEKPEKSTPARRFPWVRLWTDLPHDPKFRAVARASKQSLPNVIAVFVVLLTDAANASARGSFDIPPDDIAAALDLELDAVAAILSAMQRKLLDGNRLTGWSGRQPKREDDPSAARMRALRERNRTHGDATVTHGDAPEVEEEEDREEETERTPELKQGSDLKLHRRRARKVRPARVRFRAPDGPPEPGDAEGYETIPVNDGTEAVLTSSHIAELARLHPALNLKSEFAAMRSWVIAHPERTKTRTGVLRFVAGWLTRAQNRSRGIPGAAAGPRHRRSAADADYFSQFDDLDRRKP